MPAREPNRFLRDDGIYVENLFVYSRIALLGRQFRAQSKNTDTRTPHSGSQTRLKKHSATHAHTDGETGWGGEFGIDSVLGFISLQERTRERAVTLLTLRTALPHTLCTIPSAQQQWGLLDTSVVLANPSCEGCLLTVCSSCHVQKRVLGARSRRIDQGTPLFAPLLSLSP